MPRGSANNSEGPSWKMFGVDVTFILCTPLFLDLELEYVPSSQVQYLSK